MSRVRLLLLLGAAAGAIGFATLLILGATLAAPARARIGPAPPDLGCVPVRIPSDSGSRLSGWLVPGAPGGGAVLLLHSVRSNRREMIERARFLRDAGYASLLFDFQAHGESPGERITFGFLESRDARAALEYLRSRLPSERIGAIGVSQGAAAALVGRVPLAVDALVLEAVYPDLEQAVANRIEIRLGPLGRHLAPLLLWQVEPRLGFDPGRLAPQSGIASLRAPLLLIAGSEDRHTRLPESRRLFDRAPEPKEFWAVRGAAHQNFHRFAPAAYERRVLGFFDRYLRGGST